MRSAAPISARLRRDVSRNRFPQRIGNAAAAIQLPPQLSNPVPNPARFARLGGNQHLRQRQVQSHRMFNVGQDYDGSLNNPCIAKPGQSDRPEGDDHRRRYRRQQKQNNQNWEQ